jgi:hypothetical protein
MKPIEIKTDHSTAFVTLTGGDNKGPSGRLTMPSQRLTDPAFQYTPACKTDLKETFRRAREAMR